jgi:hypothetical protein
MTEEEKQVSEMLAYIKAEFTPDDQATINKLAAKFRSLFVAEPLAAVAASLVSAEILAGDVQLEA